MSGHFLTIDINPEPTMTKKKYSSPIPSSIPDEDINNDSGMELDPSGMEWSGPENQLGLEPNNQAVSLDKGGKIKHYKTIVVY
jgi:hypothetical protein